MSTPFEKFADLMKLDAKGISPEALQALMSGDIPTAMQTPGMQALMWQRAERKRRLGEELQNPGMHRKPDKAPKALEPQAPGMGEGYPEAAAIGPQEPGAPTPPSNLLGMFPQPPMAAGDTGMSPGASNGAPKLAAINSAAFRKYAAGLLGVGPSERLEGGLADNKADSSFDEENIEKGQDVEMEHTDNPQVAKEIAKDHLVESDEYYEKLEDLEDELEAQGDKDLGEPDAADREAITDAVRTSDDLDDDKMHEKFIERGVAPDEGEEFVYESLQNRLRRESGESESGDEEKEARAHSWKYGFFRKIAELGMTPAEFEAVVRGYDLERRAGSDPFDKRAVAGAGLAGLGVLGGAQSVLGGGARMGKEQVGSVIRAGGKTLTKILPLLALLGGGALGYGLGNVMPPSAETPEDLRRAERVALYRRLAHEAKARAHRLRRRREARE